MKKITYISALTLLIHTGLHAQQDPQYTQYLYNMSVVNPAYTTNDLGVVDLGALYRSQWVSAVGGPVTFTFFGHAAINEKIEVGLSLITDDIGDGAVKENNVYIDFAYILPLNEESHLSLGLKGGLTNFNTDFTGFRFPEVQDDPAFAENLNDNFPNVGVGAFYSRDRFYAGISVPNLLNSTHLEDRNGIVALGSEELHLFFISGYVHELDPNVSLKPSVLAKVVPGAPLSFDVSLNVLFHQRFEAGASYRWDDSVSALFNMSVLPSVRIGYAYDYTLSNLGDFSTGTHELFVLFDLDLLGLRKGYDKSPRFY